MSGPDPARPWLRRYPSGVPACPARDPRALPQLLREAAEADPARDLFDWRGGRIAVGEIASLAHRAARGLRALGIGPGDAVALHLPNHPHHPVMFFAVLIAGARVAHLSALDAPAEMRVKLSACDAALLVTLGAPGHQDKAARMAAEGAVPRLLVCDDARWGGAEGPPPPPGALGFEALLALGDAAPDAPFADPDPEVAALLQFTGGTTGAPKAARLTHANLMAAGDAFDAWYGAYPPPEGGRERALLLLPLFHIYALSVVLLRQIRGGGLIFLRERFDPAAALDDLAGHRITAMAGVPTMWGAIMARPEFAERDLSALRIASSGGAPQPRADARRFRETAGIPLLGGWGMTETCAAGTTIPAALAEAKPGTIGIPLPGIEIRIVDPEDPARTLPTGETGELAIRGPNVTAGYEGGAGAGAFRDGWFLTGDLGRMDEDGCLFLSDRKDDLILSGGFNVYPQVIEQALHEHPAIREAAVIGIPDAYRGESAKAVVALHSGAEAPDLATLNAFLAEHLGPHELPRALEIRDALPRTGVGKLSRRTLRDEEAARRAAGKAPA